MKAFFTNEVGNLRRGTPRRRARRGIGRIAVLKASFSNWGSCVDGYAPGVAIKSVWLGTGTRTISGTSMASPHVAGVGALYKSSFGDASSAMISSWISGNATSGVIRANPSGTPNRLLNKRSL